MVKSVVLKPFGWYPDGFTRDEVSPGDERDFGDATDGLKGLMMIGDVAVVPVEPAAAEPVVAVVAEPSTHIPEPAVETPVVAAHSTRRKRN